MKILDDLAELPAGPIVSIGAFDGVHLGHRRIVRQAVERARYQKAASAVLTFSPHPQKVVSPADAPPLLQTPSQRRNCLEGLGVDFLVEMPFTIELSRFTPEEFVSRVLMRCRPAEIHVGWNFRFGHKRAGDLSTLQSLGRRHGFEVRAVEPVSLRGVTVSSSKIRHLLREGQVSRAARYLGRPFEVVGTVVHGDGRGRQLGFPTANIDSPNELIPANSVYAGRIHIEGRRYPCVTNVGMRPTVHPNFEGRPVVESHILDFDNDIYGAPAALEFLARLRPEKKFDGLSALVEQIRKDVSRARRYLERTRAALFDEEQACPSAETRS